MIALPTAVLLPALAKPRASPVMAECLSNMRQLQIAQVDYASAQKNILIATGDGTEQGS